jgi:hypothetical protein
MNQIQKHPDEEFYIAGSILRVQQTGESIDLGNSTVTATDKDGTDVSSTLLSQGSLRVMDDPDGDTETDNALALILRAGTEAASPYRVVFTMDTDLSHIWVVVTYVYVVDPD